MSRQHVRKPYGGPKLPFELQQKFAPQSSQVKLRNRLPDAGNRKQQGKIMRVEKRGRKKQVNRTHPQLHGESDEDEIENENNVQIEHAVSTRASLPEPRSILKHARKPPPIWPPPTISEDQEKSSRESSPGLVLDANSRSFKERLARDDTEIRALEKRLGIKKGRKRKMSDDPLDDIINDFDEGSPIENAKRDETEWFQRKRRKSEALNEKMDEAYDDHSNVKSDSDDTDNSELLNSGDYISQSNEEEGGSSEEVELDVSDEQDDTGEDSFINGDTSFNGFDEMERSENEIQKPSKVRENPYVPPTDAGGTIRKYVPPSLRKPIEGDVQSLEKLRKQVQGQLNKLSEANIISILGEIEKIYQDNPRQDVTTTIVQLLLAAFSVRSTLPNTFIILHAAFAAATYKVVGIEFGAELVAKVVESFDKQHRDNENSGKECLNFVSLLANMFTFNVVSSGIIYDYIRLLLADFSESNAELLLRVVRDCGPQLRSDDPTALKGIVQMMQNTSAEMTKRGQQLNIRTRVMMDTIVDLKNNKMKQATNAAGITGEHLTRMRKALGTLNNRQLRGTEPLRISREDIANSDKKGKWWLVGSSWKGNDESRSNEIDVSTQSQNWNYNAKPVDSTLSQISTDPDEMDFATLSRHYKMNTAVRRSIFVAITSASDVSDALGRLAKLRLTRKQEPEIARVLLRCCRAEPTYNPYYSILAKNLLRENSRRYRMSFLIALWKFFEAMGERQHEDDDEHASDEEDEVTGHEAIQMHELVNMAKMHAFLVNSHSLSLFDLLKPLNIGMTRTQTTLWLELLFVSLFTAACLQKTKTAQKNSAEEQLLRIFSSGRNADTRTAKGLRYFLLKQVRRSDLVNDQQEKKALRSGCKLAERALSVDADVDMEIDIE